MLRFISSALLCASTISAPIALQAGGLEGSIFAIEQYRSVAPPSDWQQAKAVTSASRIAKARNGAIAKAGIGQ